MVMGGDTSSKDREFESQHRILDGHFSHLSVLKIMFEKTKINEKETGVGPFLKKKLYLEFLLMGPTVPERFCHRLFKICRF